MEKFECNGRIIEPLIAEDKQTLDSLREYAKRNGFSIFYRELLDLTGAVNSFAHPSSALSESTIFGFDGSSLRGFQSIHESDMRTVLLPETAFVDLAKGMPKLRVLARIKDPIKNEWYKRDPINIAISAAQYLKDTGIADIAYFGPEAEFFIFDKVAFEVGANKSMHLVDSEEGIWNSGKENSGYKPTYKGGYAPASPVDSLEDARAEMMNALIFNGITVETGHHEVATAGRGEIDIKYSDLITMSHNLARFKHVIKNIASAYGKTATFMPKPILGDNGSGMHVHQSLWKSGEPLFAGDHYAGLSELALHYIGGILEHGPALCALTNPSTNSYKRIVPHCEAPVNLVYSARNRSAAIRIPQYEPGNKKATRIEVRFPDPLASGYLAFSAMLMAGLDGIKRKIDPGAPFEGNVYEHAGGLKTLPGSFDEALDALEMDNEFLKKGDVFTEEFLNAWIGLKRAEIQKIRKIPIPAEFEMYYMG